MFQHKKKNMNFFFLNIEIKLIHIFYVSLILAQTFYLQHRMLCNELDMRFETLLRKSLINIQTTHSCMCSKEQIIRKLKVVFDT
jgi:hypothetical protein